MSPRSAAQFKAIRQKSRQAILDAALTLFARKGYNETTTMDIARRVGISKGLIYNYFSSKEEILESLITEGIRAALPTLTTRDSVSDPKAQLEELIHQWIRLVKSDPDFMRLGIQLHTAGAFRKVMKRRGRDFLDMFSSGLKSIFRRLGSRDPETDTLLLFSIFDGIGLNYTATPEYFPINKMEQRLLQIYCRPKREIP